MMKWLAVMISMAALMAGGCDPVSLTALGVGASAGTSHTMGGYNYRTFVQPLPKVKQAALTALKRMDIKIESTEKIEGGEVIKATSVDRNIELTLEPVSAKTTRLRSIARKGSFLMDSATATEIIVQTERVLEGA